MCGMGGGGGLDKTKDKEEAAPGAVSKHSAQQGLQT